MSKKNIEVLAPAGNVEALKAAVGNGADAVYLGAGYFNARRKAGNFDSFELEEAIDYAHLHSVKVYLTLNTLLLDSEFELALDIAKNSYTAGIDAIIVQDLGFCKVLRQNLPDLEIHASTQATIYDEYAIDACANLGVKRIIFPREFSVEDIKKMTKYANSKGIETEIFVHGALCVCYSGQCLLSSMIGARSGNRGECAQPCRLDYNLVLDNKLLSKNRAMLGTKDIYGINHIAQLIDANVSSIKIEGRMRSAQYVGLVTNVYKNLVKNKGEYVDEKNKREDLKRLLLAFNRGGEFSDNYLRGEKGPDLISDSHSGSHGILVGEVVARNSHLGVIDIKTMPDGLVSDLNKGDIVSIRDLRENKEIASAPLGVINKRSNILSVKGFHPDIIEKVKIGDNLYLMEDKTLASNILANDLRKTLINGVLSVDEKGIRLRLEVVKGISKGIIYEEIISQKELTENYDIVADDYQNIPEDRCIKQLNKIKSTPFEYHELKIINSPKAPISLLNQIRREAILGLEEKIKESFKRRVIEKQQLSENIISINEIEELLDGKSDNGNPLDNSKRTSSGVSAYFYEWNDFNPKSVLCNADRYELPIWAFFYDEAFTGLEQLKKSEPNAQFVVWLPPAYTPTEAKLFTPILEKLSKSGIYAITSGNPGHYALATKLELEFIADYSANIFNSHTAKYFAQNNAQTISPSVELSIDELSNMTNKLSKEKININVQLPIFGRLRLMYTEHCPVGYNKKDCKACEGKESMYSLSDKKNMRFPIVCHPQTCSVDILNANVLCAPQEVYNLSKNTNTYARAYFGTMDNNERINIIALSKELLSCNDLNESKYIIEKFRTMCQSHANINKTQLTKGHYNRGAF